MEPTASSPRPRPVATTRNSRIGQYSASTKRPPHRLTVPQRPRPLQSTRSEQMLVPKRGLEPPRLASLPPQGSASTNSATWALRSNLFVLLLLACFGVRLDVLLAVVFLHGGRSFGRGGRGRHGRLVRSGGRRRRGGRRGGLRNVAGRCRSRRRRGGLVGGRGGYFGTGHHAK